MTTKGAINYGDKINVLQQSSLENYSDQSNKRQIIFLCPNPNNDIDVKNSFRSNKKKTIATQDKNISKMHYPLPVAVARRNARERNRVKQVNNGFATLRQHIPTTIAAGSESGNGRGSNKKLSKVETLRMAVEYIKSLEKLLNITEEKLKNNSSSSINNYTPSYAMSESSSPFNLNYSYSSDTEDGMRSSKDNNYHLLPEDEENIHPLKMEDNEDDILQNSNLINSNLDYTHQNNMLLHSTDNNGSLSSEVYSEHSLSPIRDDTNDMKTFIPAYNVTNNQNTLPSFSQLTYDKLHQVKLELLSPNLSHNVIKEDSNHDLDKIGIATKADVGREHDPSINIIWWGNPQQSR